MPGVMACVISVGSSVCKTLLQKQPQTLDPDVIGLGWGVLAQRPITIYLPKTCTTITITKIQSTKFLGTWTLNPKPHKSLYFPL